MTDTAIEKAMELLKEAELSKGILVENLKHLIMELEDTGTLERYKADEIKQREIPQDSKKQIDHLADYLTHLCNGLAYELVSKKVKVVLAASGVLNG